MTTIKEARLIDSSYILQGNHNEPNNFDDFHWMQFTALKLFEMKGDALSQVDIELTFLKAVDIEVSLSYLSGNVLRIEIFDSSEIEVTPHGERFFVDSSHQLINDANSQVMARAKGETKEGGSDKGARPL